jgi:hypothetical protein
MKFFFKNNLSLIFNLGLLVLLFTYPVVNITGIENKKIHTLTDNTKKIENRRKENNMDIFMQKNNGFIVKPISNTQNLFQSNNMLFTKK